MRIPPFFSAALAAALALSSVETARAVILASDDFTAPDSGVGWMAGDSWEGLDTTNQRVNVPRQTGAFRELATPFDLANQITYMRMDYQRANGSHSAYGLLSLFESGGGEIHAMGIPQSNSGRYAFDAKSYGGKVDSGVVRDFGRHLMIAEIDTTNAPNVSYKFWLDSINYDSPIAVLNTSIEDYPSSLLVDRVRMQANANQTDRVYGPLVIGTEAIDVGLVSTGGAKLVIDRTTGEVSLSTATTIDGVTGYTLSSAAGGFDSTNWTTITGNYDASPGNGSVDTDDQWNVVSAPGSSTELSEEVFTVTPGDGGSIGAAPIELGSPWIRTPIEDVVATLLLDVDGTVVPAEIPVEYTGDIKFGDLNNDGMINAADWNQFKSGQGVVNPGMPAVMAYQMGDLDGDGFNLLQDYSLFRAAFDAEQGEGALAALISTVPEPCGLALVATVGCLCLRRKRRLALAPLCCVMVIALFAFPHTAEAEVFATDNFNSATSGTGWAAGDSWENLGAGVADTGVTNTLGFREFETEINPFNHQAIYIGFDFQVLSGNNWGGVSFFEDLNNPSPERLFMGRPGAFQGYGLDLSNGFGSLNSGVPFDNEQHRFVVRYEFDNPQGSDTYSIWIDNFDVNTPDATITLNGPTFPINNPWQSLRIASSTSVQLTVDNLIIANQDSVAEVFAQPELLTAVVNKATGEISLLNDNANGIAINGYSLTSVSGSFSTGAPDGDFNDDGTVNAADYTLWRDNLNEPEGTLANDPDGGVIGQAQYDTWHSNYGATGSGDAWQSIASQNLAGFPVGDGSGNGWEEGAEPGSLQVAEYFLQGESTVPSGSPISLGSFYGGGLAGPEDVLFEYVNSEGSVVKGLVAYVTESASGSLHAAPEPTSLLSLAILGVIASGVHRLRC